MHSYRKRLLINHHVHSIIYIDLISIIFNFSYLLYWAQQGIYITNK